MRCWIILRVHIQLVGPRFEDSIVERSSIPETDGGREKSGSAKVFSRTEVWK